MRRVVMRDGKRGRRFSGGGSGDTHFGCFGRLQRKLAENSGLTMIEMLCATIILTLLCVMLSTGLSMATYDYRMLTAEAEAELLVDTIVSSLTDRLRGSTLRVNVEERKYSHDMSEVGIAGDGRPNAGIAEGEPAQGTVIIGQYALLPDGAYGAVFSKDDANGKKRRYEVTEVSVSVAVTDISDTAPKVLELPLPDNWAAWDWLQYPGSDKIAGVTYTIKVTVKDRVTGVSKSTPEDGIKVRCLNPVS